MVRRCNAVGVRIYPDVVINHMSGGGESGQGTGGCDYVGGDFSYPCVPFGRVDFNVFGDQCPNPTGQIEDYSNPIEVRNCELVGLRDLKLGAGYARGKIVEYLNTLISHGVAGFRVDAAKHMWPGDLETIFGQLTSLSTEPEHGFPIGARAFMFQEVIDLGNEPISGSEYFVTGRVTEFKYGANLGRVFRGQQEQLKELVNWGEGWDMYPSNRALAFVDNHDNQRGHGAGGADILTFRDARLYKMATAFKLAHPYGVTRIMSSYGWEPYEANWMGPPSTNDEIDTVPINPDLTCGGGWICEHRWRQIYNMVRFRNVAVGTGLNDWWDDDGNQIAFSRGDKGFIAINNGNSVMNADIPTTLTPGSYCDVISGNKEGSSCTGKTITVGADGNVSVNIPNTDEDPVIAIHAESML